MYKLFAILTRFGAIVLSLLFTSEVSSLPTEYVFTAPPEVDLEVEEIPTQEEYPLYECNGELEQDEVFDSHNCGCVDCEDLAEESKEDMTQQKQPEEEQTINDKSVN